jgi:hypothetical protein
MTDPHDELDALLRAGARDYNRPGDAPRDRMWENIRAERGRRAPVARQSSWRRFVLPAVAAALLVIGVAIGRIYEHLRPSQPKPVPTVATHVLPDSASRLAPNVTPSEPSATKVASAPAPSAPEAGRSQRPSSRAAGLPPNDTAVDEDQNLAFRLAVVQHLAGTEALLTSFRDGAARGEVDAQITSWARKLLTTTRLLQTAAAQQDPTMKRLLDDLELVLVQIAQYSPTNPHRAEELELIEHSIQRRGVIGKLRTTIPARLAPSGT